MKKALDHVHNEWAHAPVGCVSYGGIGAGIRSVQQLKQVVTTLRMVPVFESVNIPFVGTLVHVGELSASAGMATAARDMLSELQRVESALHWLRRSSVSAAG